MAPHAVSASITAVAAAAPPAGTVRVYDSLTPWWSGARRSRTVRLRALRDGVKMGLTPGGLT